MRINYTDVMWKVTQMRAQAVKLYYQIYRLKMVKDTLRRNWDGPASEIYQKKLLELIHDMEITRNKIINTTEDIEATAKAIRRADLEAAENARQL